MGGGFWGGSSVGRMVAQLEVLVCSLILHKLSMWPIILVLRRWRQRLILPSVQGYPGIQCSSSSSVFKDSLGYTGTYLKNNF